MARDRVTPFVKMVEDACVRTSVQGVFEAMRMFGYVNEQQYSELNTTWMKLTASTQVRSDGAETIELARFGLRPLNMHDSEDIPPLSKAIKKPQDDGQLMRERQEITLEDVGTLDPETILPSEP